MDSGRWPCRRKLAGRRHLSRMKDFFQFRVMLFELLQGTGNLQEAHGPGPVWYVLVALFSVPR